MNEENYTVEIFLTKEAIREAQELGNQPYEYRGPTFKEVEMTRTDDGFLTVINKDGSFYLFPASRIARVKGKPNDGLSVTRKLTNESDDYDVRVTFRGKLLTSVRMSYIIHKQMENQAFWPTLVHKATEAEGLGFTYDEVDEYLKRKNK